jgi:hypothetical protein
VVVEKEGEDQMIRSFERNEEVLCAVKQEINIVHTTERSTANWIGHILRRNSFLKHVIEENIEGTRTREIRRRQLFDGLKERTEDTRG